jgi:hypothetical protein
MEVQRSLYHSGCPSTRLFFQVRCYGINLSTKLLRWVQSTIYIYIYIYIHHCVLQIYNELWTDESKWNVKPGCVTNTGFNGLCQFLTKGVIHVLEERESKIRISQKCESPLPIYVTLHYIYWILVSVPSHIHGVDPCNLKNMTKWNCLFTQCSPPRYPTVFCFVSGFPGSVSLVLVLCL